MSTSTQTELISVIIPVYKVERYLDACVQSVLAQTYRELEIILIDDGSPDACGELCDRYAAQDPRIRVIHQDNHGLAAVRNVGVDAAHGKWIAFVDSDDTIHPRMLERLLSTAREQEAEIVRCGFIEFADGESPAEAEERAAAPGWRRIDAREAELEYYLPGRMAECMVVWNKLYLASLFGTGEERLRYPEGHVFEDGFVTYRLLYRAERIVVLDAALYYYRVQQDSIMKSHGNRNYRDALLCDRGKTEFFEEKGERELYLKQVNFTTYEAIRFYEKADTRAARAEIRAWFLDYYHSYFLREKREWTLAKRLRVGCFAAAYPLYRIISAFEGLYNQLRGASSSAV